MESDANLAQNESSNCTVESRDESNDEIDEEDSDNAFSDAEQLRVHQ